jgi:sugar phosphate isomerase/epimerase
MYTRRQFGKLAAATVGGLSLADELSMCAAAQQTPEAIQGIQLGLESYGLMPYPQEGVIDLLIRTMIKLHLRSCSLQEFLLLPPRVRTIVDDAGGPDRASPPNTPEFQAKIKLAEDALQEWRTTVSLDSLRAIRKRFDTAGLGLYGYMPNNLRTVANSSDEDLNRACEIARALGVGYMAVMIPKSAAKRFVPIAEKYEMKVGLHGHPSMQSSNPDIIATPADYLEAVSWSKNYAIHFDIGNATAGGYDVVSFVKQNHQHLGSLAIKDRGLDRKSKPWGQGDSHVSEILRLVRDDHYPIHCWIDCDYATEPGRTRIDDIARCQEYAKASLTN